MQTFIRAVEYWVPSSDGSILEFGAGAYGTGRHLESLSHQMCFGLGEGPAKRGSSVTPSS